jgi:hypothetical protein
LNCAAAGALLAAVDYFVFRHGEQEGPFAEEQVRQMLAEGAMQGGDLAWHEGLEEWKPLESLITVARPEPAPPVARPPDQASAIKPAQTASEPAPPYRKASTPMGKGTKLAIALGALGFVVAAVIAGLGLAFLLRLNSSAEAYTDAYLTHIAPAWSVDGLMSRLTPEYRERFTPAATQRMFQKLGTLGALKHYDGSKGAVNVNQDGSTHATVANVTAHATFEHGAATFQILLVQVNGKWTIAGFHVQSPVFD